MELLTIAEIARRLNLPESTVRYYRDRFATYIPEIGEGRSRRYKPEAFEILQFIAEMMRTNTPAEAVEAALQARFAVNIEPQQQTTGTQQHASAAIIREMFGEAMREIMAQQTAAMREEMDAVKNAMVAEIAATREENRQLREALEQQTQAIQEVSATLSRVETYKKKGFLARLFKK